MFHVSFAEFLEGYLCRSSVDAPNDLRLSKCKKRFGVPLIRTLRRLLYSLPVLIVVVDPPNATSSVDSHLRLLFYPLPAARDILRDAWLSCLRISDYARAWY